LKALAALLAVAWIAVSARAADPVWPPTPEAQARIEVLRRTLGSTTATPEQRQSARDELARLLMNPGARTETAIAPKPPRAAVDPARPAKPAVPAAPPVATVTPVAPTSRASNPVPDGRGGTVVPPVRTVIDPKSGAILNDVGSVWFDPVTGRFIPKP
jgi:hypothetical protein